MHRSRTIRQLKSLSLAAAVVAFAFVATAPSQAKADTTDEQVVSIGFDSQHESPVTQTASSDFGPEVSVFARQRGVASAPLPPAVVSGAFLLASNFVVTRLWKNRKI